MPKFPDIQLPTALKERLTQGHPWVYRNHTPAGIRLETGSIVRVRCGSWSAYALWDADGPIALRIFSERSLPDAALVRARVRDAWALREPLRNAGCTAYRWLFGEGDGLPGLTVDRYGDFAIVQSYSPAVETLLPALASALHECDPQLRGVVMRQRSASQENDGAIGRDEALEEPETERSHVRERHSLRVLSGGMPPSRIVVREHGLQFYADLRVGQKTGLFLDHRENRRYIEGISSGRSVLNCFAYTGAFSLYALRGGAREVVSTDIGKGLADAAAENSALNMLDAGRHSFVTADCFDLLSEYVAQGRRFDIIILDPPSFAKSKQNRFAALRAYTKLNALALRCIAPGGILASASCTSQVGPEAFKEMLAAAGQQAERRLQIIHEAGQPLDHPVPAHFPEGRYLKFVVARVQAIG